MSYRRPPRRLTFAPNEFLIAHKPCTDSVSVPKLPMPLVCSLLSVMRFLRFASWPMRPATCPMRDARWFPVKATCSLLYVTRCLLAAFWPLRVCYMLASLQELRSAPWSTHHALCSLPHLLHDACPLIFVLYQMRYALGLIITYA